MLKHLEIADFDQLYHLMEASFPRDEYRPYAAQKALLYEQNYRVYANYGADGIVNAFLAVWEFEHFAFIEHFAVRPECRSNGLGSRLLWELVSTLNKLVCLETELPETELAKRRIGFYQRNGFFRNPYSYMQPALSAGQAAVPLCIMTFPVPITVGEFTVIRDALYQKVYKVK